MTDNREKRSTDRVCVAANSPSREADRYQRLLQAVNRILTQAIRAESEEALGKVCLTVALEVTDSAIGFLGEVGPNGLLHTVAISEMNGEQGRLGPSGHRRPPLASMLHELYNAVITGGKSLLANDLSSHRAGVDLPPGHLPLTTLLGVPLIYDGRPIGVLAVANCEGGYGPQQQEDLEALTPTVVECLYRRRAEEELRESEALYRAIAQHFPGGAIYIFDRDLRFHVADGEAVERLGFTREQLEGKTIWEATDEETCKILDQRYLRVLAGEKLHFETSYKGRVFSSDYVPIRDDHGNVTAGMVVSHDITERVRTEEALRESEEATHGQLAEIDSIYRSAPVGLCVIDDQLRFVRINERMAELNGVPAAEHIGRTPREIVPDLADQAEALLRRILDTGEPMLDVEFTGTTPAQPGVLRTWIAQWLPIKDAAGRVVGVNVVADEITERVRTEEALREGERRFRRVLENSRDIIFRLNLRTYQYDYLSPAIAELTGFTAEEFMAAGHRKMLNHVHPEDRERYVSAVRASWQSPDARNNHFRYRFRHKDGAYRWLSNNWTVVMDDGGQPIALVGTTRDVTGGMEAAAAQREAEEQRVIAETVAEERQRLLDVLETLPAMICLLTSDHRIAFANRAFREKFGVSQGRHCYERCFGRAEPCEFCEAYRVLETGQPHHWEVTLADGAIIDVYNFPFTDVDGTPMILEMNIDITEGRRTQEALVQAERMAVVGRMAATLTHEINNPLQAVVGCLGLAMEVLPENQDADRYLSVAMEELKRAARIVQRIHDLGRQNEGRREFSALGDLVQRTMILTHGRARGQGVKIVWNDGAQLPLVPLVRDRIQQVFLNLTLNALDAMPEGGELRISAAPTAKPPGVGVSFADTGKGIPPETMERLFTAFYTTKPLEMGLGLGLHVSRNIIKEHGGRIDVESEVGRGTTFTVWLPTEQGE